MAAHTFSKTKITRGNITLIDIYRIGARVGFLSRTLMMLSCQLSVVSCWWLGVNVMLVECS
jgi:hypothetical protein